VGDRHPEEPEEPLGRAARRLARGRPPRVPHDRPPPLRGAGRAVVPGAVRPERRSARAEASDGETYNWSASIEPGTFYANYFRPALAAVGLPATDPKTGTRGVRLHDLRNTYAVLSLSTGRTTFTILFQS
jgi:hypothetical protein